MAIIHEAVAGALGQDLAVSDASWAAESLTIWGEEWSFSTMSSWRVVRDDRLLCSCFHKPETANGYFEGTSVEAVDVRPGAAIDDITLTFTGGIVLEVFSDMVVEPWVFHLPKCTYVPSDIHD